MNQRYRSMTPNPNKGNFQKQSTILRKDDSTDSLQFQNQVMRSTMTSQSSGIKIRKLPKVKQWQQGDVQNQNQMGSQIRLGQNQNQLSKLRQNVQKTQNMIKVRKIVSLDPAKRKAMMQTQMSINSNQLINMNNKNLQPGDKGQDIKGNIFEVQYPITQNLIKAFVENTGNIQQKQNFQYKDILNIAKELGINTKEEILQFSKDIELAMQPGPYDNQQWYYVLFRLSKQYAFFNSETRECLKRHPRFQEYYEMIQEKKRVNFVEIEPVTQLFFQKYVELKEMNIKSVDIQNEIEKNQFQLIDKAIKELKLNGLEQIKHCQDIIMKNITPPEDCVIVKQSTGNHQIQYFNQKTQDYYNHHPELESMKKTCQQLIASHNYQISDVTEEEIRKYQKKEWLDKDKKDILDKYISFFQFKNLEKDFAENFKQVKNQILESQEKYKPIRMSQSKEIMFKIGDGNNNQGQLLKKPPGFKQISKVYKEIPQITDFDLDIYFAKGYLNQNQNPTDREKNQNVKLIVDKVLKDMGIQNENEKKQNKNTIYDLFLKNPDYQNLYPIIYKQSKNIAFLDKSNNTIIERLPNLPAANKLVAIAKITTADVDRYFNNQRDLNKNKILVINKCFEDLQIDVKNTQHLQDYHSQIVKMVNDPIYRPVKMGPKSTKILFQNRETQQIEEVYPELPPHDQIFNYIGEIQVEDLNTDKLLGQQDKKDQINNYLKYLEEAVPDCQDVPELLKTLIEEDNSIRWTLVKFAKSKKICLLDEETGETRDFPENFPKNPNKPQNSNTQVRNYLPISNVNSKDLKNYLSKVKMDEEKRDQIDKYYKYFGIYDEQEKKFFQQHLGELIDKQLSKDWQYSKDKKSKKRVFVNQKDKTQTMEYPESFPSKSEIINFNCQLQPFTEQDIEQYVNGTLQIVEKKRELDQYLIELGISQENKKDFEDTLKIGLVQDKEWDRFYSIGDKRKFFKNKLTGDISSLPPKFPTEDDIKNAIQILDKITQEDVDNYIRGRQQDPKKKIEIDDICKKLNLHTEQLKRDFKCEIFKSLDYNENDFYRGFSLSSQQICYRNKQTGLTSEFPPNYPNQETIKNITRPLQNITEVDIQDYLKGSQTISAFKKKIIDQACINLDLQSIQDKQKFKHVIKKVLIDNIGDDWEIAQKINGQVIFRNKNTHQMQEKSPNFPSTEEINSMEAVIDRLSMDDLKNYSDSIPILPVKKKILDNFSKKLELKNQYDIQKYLIPLLEDPIIKNLGQEYDLIEKKDGSIIFKNNRTNNYEQFPPKFPTVEDKKLMSNSVDQISIKDIESYITGNQHSVDSYKIGILNKISENLGLKDQSQKQKFKHIINKVAVDSVGDWKLVQKFEDLSIQYKNTKTGEFSNLPPNLPSKEEMAKEKIEEQGFQTDQIEKFLKNDTSGLDQYQIQELDNMCKQIGITSAQIQDYQDIFKELYIQDFQKIEKDVQREIYGNGQQNYIYKDKSLGESLYSVSNKVVTDEDIDGFLNEQKISSSIEKEIRHTMKILGIKKREDAKKNEQFLKQYVKESQLDKNVKKIALLGSKEFIFIDGKGGVSKEHPAMQNIKANKQQHEKENTPVEVKHLTCDDIAKYANNQEDPNLPDNVKEHLKVIFENLEIEEEWQRKAYFGTVAQLIDSTAGRTQKRVTLKGKVGYLVDELTNEISPFPPNYPKKEKLNLFHVKVEQFKKQELQEFINGELSDKEKQLYLDELCQKIGIVTKYDKIDFQKVIQSMTTSKEGWERVRYIKGNQVKYVNKQENKVSEVPPSFPDEEELKKIVVKIDGFNAENYDVHVEQQRQEAISGSESARDKNDEDEDEDEIEETKRDLNQSTFQEKNKVKYVPQLNDKFQEHYDKFLKEIGLKDYNDKIQYGQYIKEELQNYDKKQFICFRHLVTQSIQFIDQKTQQQSPYPPNLQTLKDIIILERKRLIMKQEAIGASRVDALYEATFQASSIHKDLEITNNGTTVTVKKGADPSYYKAAFVEPKLIPQTIRRFAFQIMSLGEKSQCGIGYLQPQQLEENKQIKNDESIPAGVYLLSPKAQELINQKEYNKHKEKIEKQCNKEFQYKTGDVIVTEIDLFKGSIEYKNESTKQIYIQKAYSLKSSFYCGLALKNPGDSIKILPRSDFPIHFTLTWEHKEVDMDMSVVCPCKNRIYYKNKKCDTCHTYLDKDHRTGENPVEHIFIRQLPKEGQVWRYQAKYFSFYTDVKEQVFLQKKKDSDKAPQNLAFSMAVYSVHNEKGKDIYNTIDRLDGFLPVISSVYKSKYKFEVAKVQKFMPEGVILEVEKPEPKKPKKPKKKN